MVAVPYSKGCRTCLQRRIKCDESRPGCQRCAKRGVQCPGYRKPFTFLPVQTPSHGGKQRDRVPQSTDSMRDGQPSKTPQLAVAIREWGNFCTSVDELIAPGLTQKAWASQWIESLSFFIDATVPGLYYTYSNRVAMSWMNFARRHANSTLDPLVWSIRSLGTLHMGYNHQDQSTIAQSRAMYGRGLRGLSILLQDPQTARSDITCAISVMLGIFEMLDGNTRQSWLTHSTGIATLIRLRGPDAHRSGFGRTIFVSFRSYIVSDALIRGQPCFLAEPAWRSMLCETLLDDKANGKSCRLVELAELTFTEVTGCPGLYARTCAMIKNGGTDPTMRQDLLDDTTRCRNRLQCLKDQLESDFPSWINDEELRNRPDIVALIPVTFARKFRNLALRGSQSALALLDQIVVLVNSDSHRQSMGLTGSASQTWAPISLPSITPLMTIGREDMLANGLPAWPDELALSMGMLGMKDA